MNELSKGYAFIHVDAHGRSYYWVWNQDSQTDFYSTYNAKLFQNPCYSMILTCACSTNAYDLQEHKCLSEEFIRNPSGNILAYLGCSRKAWSGKKYELGPSMSYNAIFYDSLFSDINKHYGDIVKKTRTGYASKFEMAGKKAYRWVLLGVNPVGDPEMPIFTSVPNEMTNVSFLKNGNYLTIDAGICDCRMCVMSIEDNGHSLYEVKDSIQSLTMCFPRQNSCLCITKSGYKPYIIYIMNQQYIQNETLSGKGTYVSNYISIGKDVTPLLDEGPVIIENGKICVVSRNSTTIKNSFEVKLGAEFEIR